MMSGGNSGEYDGGVSAVARPTGGVGPNGDRGLSRGSGMMDCGGWMVYQRLGVATMVSYGRVGEKMRGLER